MKIRNVKDPKLVAEATHQVGKTYQLVGGAITAPGEWITVEETTPVTYPAQE